ncbi:MAG: hypothetical protein PHE59_00520 [Patescibacteria group bacterium]|nr:hypothetical protein [Patescibacteria group bacterium]MDD5164797.1 hypothetical protein [Patescibacteria group bacterium]MDD5534781.1 hypothetical protein [Patescibacteria group bacterium]
MKDKIFELFFGSYCWWRFALQMFFGWLLLVVSTILIVLTSVSEIVCNVLGALILREPRLAEKIEINWFGKSTIIKFLEFEEEFFRQMSIFGIEENDLIWFCWRIFITIPYSLPFILIMEIAIKIVDLINRGLYWLCRGGEE